MTAKEITKEETRVLALQLLLDHYGLNAAELNNLDLFLMIRNLQAYVWSHGYNRGLPHAGHGLDFSRHSMPELINLLNILKTLSWTLPDHLIVLGPARENK